MTTVTLTLPVSTRIKNFGTDEAINVDWAQVPANVLEQVLVTGAKTMLINAWNSGGADVPEQERAARTIKKIDAWYRGEINTNGRGPALETLMRECYRMELEAALGKLTDAAWLTFQQDEVKKAGKTNPAKGKTVGFELFIECRAINLAKRAGEKRSATDIQSTLETKFEAAANALAAERAKALGSIDTSGLDF